MQIGKKFLMKIYNLKNLIRYNHRFRVTDETVAEHSYYVATFTTLLCKYFGTNLTIENKAIKYALLHDIPEIELSDIPYSTKMLSNELATCIHKLECNVVKKVIPSLYEDFLDIHIANIKDHSEDFKARFIVDVADVLSVLQYCFLERSLGNSHMECVLATTYKRLSELNEVALHLFNKDICLDDCIKADIKILNSVLEENNNASK